MAVARRVVEQAIGEHMDGTPLEKPKEPRTRLRWEGWAALRAARREPQRCRLARGG